MRHLGWLKDDDLTPPTYLPGWQNQTLGMIYTPDYCVLLQSCSIHTSKGNTTVSYEIM